VSAAPDLFGLADRVAIVAGGGGAIGRAIGQRFIDAGARVVSLDLAGREGPAGAQSLTCDLTSPAAVDEALRRIDRDAGRLDVVVHAAGIIRDARLWKLAADDWRAVMATNLDSAFWLLQRAVPAIRRTGPGSIVMISSINGERGKIGQAAYAASKGGLEALTRTAARELGAFGIRVNAVAPGWIDTPLTAQVPEEARRGALAETVLGRVGVPDDVAGAVLFLASDLSRHVTGQILRVDGGQLIG